MRKREIGRERNREEVGEGEGGRKEGGGREGTCRR